MSSDLEIARARCSFDIKAIGEILFPAHDRETKQRVVEVLKKEKIFDHSIVPHLNHTQLVRRSLINTKRLLELRSIYQWGPDEWREAIKAQDDHMGMSLHEGACVSVIESQGSDEQQAKWVHRLKKYEFIGCYAQTELGHGSNVQGLMTTATFNPANDEFIIDSNGLEGTKWWIGALGVMATHALVQAILHVPSVNDTTKTNSYGPHLFIVPVRSLDTHTPLPGVKVGDIGPKAYGGFASLDNGYANFSGVRVPRENMLMRFAKLTKEGHYIPAKHDKLSYGSMVALRAGIPDTTGWQVARAITSAIRYCTVRRQFANTSATGDKTEVQVITYAAVRYRLYPILAQSYAYIIAGRQLWISYLQLLDDLTKRGDITMLGEMHSLSSALKALTTWDGVASIEEARKSMGGHGYSAMSRAGHWFANTTPAQTYEGDNYVIAQQTARSLLKHMGNLGKGKPYSLPSSSNYIRIALSSQNIRVSNSQDWKNKEVQISALEHRAANLLQSFAISVASENKPWSEYSFETARVTRAHAELYIVKEFWNSVGNSVELNKLAQLYGISVIVASTADIVEAGIVSAGSIRDLRRVLGEVIDSLSVSDVVGLTDAFGFTDWELGALGATDGKVYEKMWEEVNGKEAEEERAKLMEVYGAGGWDGLKDDVLSILGHWKKAEQQKAKL